ncbi:MAG: leucine-rich repeat domain-containing protein [Bacteroidales bacterium]|nr:leucine-rich repeat domain-containing protein [Bacteroidales bacterium]
MTHITRIAFITIAIMVMTAANNYATNNETFSFITNEATSIKLMVRLNNSSSCSITIGGNTKHLSLNANKYETIELHAHEEQVIHLSFDSASITGLIAEDCNLKSIDLSKVSHLKELYLSNNQLQTINLKKNQELESIGIAFNELTSIDVSNCKTLKELFLAANNLKQIKLGLHTNLKILHCTDNSLRSIDFECMPKLQQVYCSNNQLQKLDLSIAGQLNILESYSNPLELVILPESRKLTYMNIGNNAIITMNEE